MTGVSDAVPTRVHTGTETSAGRGACPTGDWWEDDLCTTVTGELAVTWRQRNKTKSVYSHALGT